MCSSDLLVLLGPVITLSTLLCVGALAPGVVAPGGAAGPKSPHLGLCPGLNVPLKRRQGSQGGVPDSPGVKVFSRV